MGNGDSSYAYGNWMCVACPCPVKYYNTSMERYSIICYHKNHWYEFQIDPLDKKYFLYCIDYYAIPDYATGEIDHRTNRILMKDVPLLENITPENAKTKIATILTFS